jgi:AraC-like DNA-binding protein
MKAPRAVGRQFRFSTRALPERERLPAWGDVLARTVARLDLEPVERATFHAEATVCQLPTLGVVSAFSSAVHLRHAPEPIADDDLAFVAAPSCAWSIDQLGRRLKLAAGDGVLLTNDAPWSLRLAADATFTALRLPKLALSPWISDVSSVTARSIPAANLTLQLLVSYLASSLAIEALVVPELTDLTVAHVHHLVAVALGGARNAAAPGKRRDTGRGARAARLRAIKADILAHLGDRTLSLRAVAMREGISPVYIRKLFETQGTSFSQFVLGERLARAHRLLSDSRFANRPIGAIAMEAGFGDLSYFNRAFRRRYGASPSDVRAAARGG